MAVNKDCALRKCCAHRPPLPKPQTRRLPRLSEVTTAGFMGKFKLWVKGSTGRTGVEL